MPKKSCSTLSYLKLYKATHLPIWVTSNTNSIPNSLFQTLRNPNLPSGSPTAQAALLLELFQTVFSVPDKCPGPEGGCPHGLQMCFIPSPPHNVFLRPSMPRATKLGSSGRAGLTRVAPPADPMWPANPSPSGSAFSFPHQNLLMTPQCPHQSSLLCLAFETLHDHPNNMQLGFIPKG